MKETKQERNIRQAREILQACYNASGLYFPLDKETENELIKDIVACVALIGYRKAKQTLVKAASE